jgi:dCMP deaminase
MEKQHIRPTRDEYFMEVSRTVAKRATCSNGRNGCVIAKNKQIICTWYVGSPPGLPHCDDIGHQFKQMTHEDGRVTNHCVRTVHAEQNAICQAAKNGVSVDWATIYCKTTPCKICTMLIISCGIKKVICEKKYQSWKESEEIFKEAWVDIKYFSGIVEEEENDDEENDDEGK